MKKIYASLVMLILVISTAAQDISVIPAPVSLKQSIGTFTITRHTVIAVADGADRKSADFLNNYIANVYGFKLDIDRYEGKNFIRLNTKKFITAPDKDAYSLSVNADGVTIEGDTHTGTFYGMQTLIQLLPYNIKTPNNSLTIPLVYITDYPRFNYRGMHLDVARHFFDVDFIKKYIDYLALHKMNYFHWHLTDDQGWRIEIKRFPELTNTGAWRDGTIAGRYPGTHNDNTRYGGFYTQDEIKDVVQYAADRHITVIPEIEMPGHASAAIAAYPFLSCFPGEETVIPSHPSEASKQKRGKKVQETWGVFEDVFCAGKDSTFWLLEGVMEEVLSLFPSRYIHAGGDESPRANWKRCPRCQLRIKDQGLKDEHQLQSYFIQRMEKYLNSKGRVLIGWDEILEGGLAPNAVVMSWRGEKGGVEAAKQNHDVIMTPQKPVYFDHSQSRNEDSLVIGGFNPLEAVYEYEPLPKELSSAEGKHVLGAQANLWTEYIRYPSKVEYHIFPRMSALSEVLWSPQTSRNWNDFQTRLPAQFSRYELWNAHYSKAYYDLKVALSPAASGKGLVLTAEPRDNKGQIKYTVNNEQEQGYVNPIDITRSGDYMVRYYRDGSLMNQVPLKISVNKATGKKITLSKQPTSNYPGQSGAFSLINGIWSYKGLSYPDWLGWIGDDIRATIDLGTSTSFSKVRLHTLDQNGSWIYLPKHVEVQVSSNGKKFRRAGRSSEFVKDHLTMGWITVRFPAKKARYIRVIAKNYGVIPAGMPGGGNKAWIFADEIQVE